MYSPTTPRTTSVAPPTDADYADMEAYDNDEQEWLRSVGALAAVGEAGRSTLERLWHRPTLEVVGLAGGHLGEGMKTIVPHAATAKLVARLVPGQVPTEIAALIAKHVARHAPPAVNVTAKEAGFAAHPYATRRDDPTLRTVARVLEEMYGTAPQFERSGASIPALAAFRAKLGVDTIPFAFALPTDGAHAPDEHMSLAMFHHARQAYIRLLHELDREAAEAVVDAKEEL